jgi:chitodextrinase
MRRVVKCVAPAVVVVLLAGSAACRDATVPETEAVSLARAGSGPKPTAPTNLRSTGTTAFSVSLAWDPSSVKSGTFSYRVRHSSGYEVTLPQTATSFTWTGHLESRGTYSFWVYAVDEAGNKSALSNGVTVTLPADTQAPTAPVLSATDIGPTHITLAWTATDDGPYIFYLVSMNGVLAIGGPTSATSSTFYLLQPSTTYTFTAQARDNGVNWSPVSEPFTVTTKATNPADVQPPSTPTNLSADGYGDGSTELLVTWTASTDDLDPQSIIRYDVYVNGVLEDIAVGRSRSTVYGVWGSNTIEVRAVDTAGNASAPATVTRIIGF